MTSEIRQTVEDIFQTAADLDLTDRAHYLDRVCAGDELLRREVEELLHFYEPDETFLEKPALQDAAVNLAKDFVRTKTQDSTLREGDWMLGPYRVLDQVGRGGMGVVYLALDTRDERQVAIKILPKDVEPDEDRLARFTREGRMLSALKHLKHPNIAEIYEQAEYDGKPCIVLEYVPGETLSEHLRNGPLPVNEALQIALQVADALKSAHDQHIVHRDLKPANIKITPDDKVKVLDFGLAKRFQSEFANGDADFRTRSLSLTESGMLLGTPAYMSPEQWNGQTIDQRTDIWAFGCLLFEMLAGQAPFTGKNRSETMKAVFDASPNWQALPGNTPLVVQDLLRRCFERNPATRLNDAGAIRLMLAEAVGDRFAPLLFIKSQIWKVNRQMAWAMASVTLVLFLGLAWQYTPLKHWVRQAVGAEFTIGEKDDVATLLAQKMKRKGSSADIEQIRAALVPDRQSSVDLLGQSDSLHKNQYYPQAIDEIIKELNDLIKDGKESAQLYAILAQAHLFKFYLSSKIEDKDAAVAAGRKAQALNPESFEVQLALGDLFNAIDSPDQALAILDKARLTPANSNNPKLLYEMAIAYDLKQESAQAEEFYVKALAQCEAQSNVTSCARYSNELGAFYFVQGNYEQAAANWVKVTQQDQFNPFGYSNLGSALIYQGCFEKAVEVCTRSIAVKTTVDGYSNRGMAYFFQGKFAEAVKDFERITIYGQDLQDSNQVAWIWGNLGDAYRMDNRAESALPAYQKAINLADAHLSNAPDDSAVAVMRAEWMAKALSIGAQDIRENPVKLIEPILASSPSCAGCYGTATLVYYFSGDLAKAAKAAQTAIQNGYSPFVLTHNPELERLKQEKEFQQIIQKYQPKC